MTFSAVLFALLVFAAPSDDPDRDDQKRALVAQRTDAPLIIDGRLEEADWQHADFARGFKQSEPDEGANASQSTEVRVLYGQEALYIGATLFDEAPAAIMQTLGRRDALNQADWFMVSIDAYLDRKTAYTFGLNAAGVQIDGIQTGRLDLSWDAVWDAQARVTPEGWVVEMQIPYAMLRFAEADAQTWGINFQRVIPRLGETSEWALVRRTEMESGRVAHFGELVGLKDISPRRNVQVMPYTVTRVQTDEADAGGLQASRSMDLGGDLKVGISSNVTLDATFNPDFGQVESDPAELNLTAFETFFSERRPFFVEGAQIFDFTYGFRDGALLYTRRIGGRAPIIGAAKLSGRTEQGLSVGLLGAATGNNFDPDRLYAVSRLKQEIGRYSNIGGMMTAYNYRAEGLTQQSLAGGLDWDLRFLNNQYQAEGHLSYTRRMQPQAAVATETGEAFSMELAKVRGTWTYSSSFRGFSDDFNPNDLGRLRSNNYLRWSSMLSYQVNGGKPVGPLQRMSTRAFVWKSWSYTDWMDQGIGTWFRMDAFTKGFQQLDLNVTTNYLLGGYDIFETRGLGPWKAPREVTLRTSFSTDTRRAWQVKPNLSLTTFEHGGDNLSLGLSGQWNAGNRLTLASEVGVGRQKNVLAWASNQSFLNTEAGWTIGLESSSPASVTGYQAFDADGVLDAVTASQAPYDAAGAFFLPLMGRRDTRSFDLNLRSNITFSPDLSLQLYTQLFVARGQFEDYQLLTGGDTLTPLPSYPKQHDFGLSSFQTNLVLRWEYRPGSTLFMVWSQARSGREALDPFDQSSRSPFRTRTFDQLSDTFGIFPTNVFLIKLNYMFLR